MVEKRKLDFFDIFVFDRDEEADALPAEPQGEHVPLIDLTVDSDEDDASNSAVIQRKQPQRTRRPPKRAQPSQEPATGEVSSSSKRQSVKTRERRKCLFTREHHVQPTRGERQGCSSTRPRLLQG